MGTFFRNRHSVNLGYQTVSNFWNYGHIFRSWPIIIPNIMKFLPVVTEIGVQTELLDANLFYSAINLKMCLKKTISSCKLKCSLCDMLTCKIYLVLFSIIDVYCFICVSFYLCPRSHTMIFDKSMYVIGFWIHNV